MGDLVGRDRAVKIVELEMKKIAGMFWDAGYSDEEVRSILEEALENLNL